MEKNYRTRESVESFLEDKAGAFLAFLDGVNEEQLLTLVTLPFGMGELPLGMMITFPAMHTMVHTGQLEYLQTIYGDRVWH